MKRLKASIWKGSIWTLLALAPSTSYASAFVSMPIDKLFERSTFVAAGRVSEVSGKCESTENCRPIYLFSFDERTVRKIKGELSSAAYKDICSNIPLELDVEYTVFIEQPSKFNTSGSKKCHLVVDFDGVFQNIGGDVYRIGAIDHRIRVGFEGEEYVTDGVMAKGFEIQLRELSEDQRTGSPK